MIYRTGIRQDHCFAGIIPQMQEISMKKVKIVIIFSFLICFLFPSFVKATKPLEVNAKAALLVEAETGTIYYAKNESDHLFPASTTKMMTALLAIEAIEREEVRFTDLVEASATSQEGLVWDGSTQNIVPGEIMSLEDLLYCALVASANEACNIIAEYVSKGSVMDFVQMMNHRAEALGCRDTHFSNTHGLPSDDHYTTAYDLYLIAAEALKHPEFVRICNTTTWETSATNLSEPRLLNTTNSLIIPEKTEYYQYAAGIKTGSTSEAGFCLVSSAEKDEIHLISVVLGAEAVPLEDESYEIGSFSETRKMFQWFYSSFSYKNILKSSELICEVPVALGEGMDSVVVRPSASLRMILPNEVEPESFVREITVYSQADGGDPLLAPVKADQVLGELSLTYNGQTYGPITLVAITDVALSKIEYMKARIRNTLNQTWVKWTIAFVVLIFAAYIAFVIRYNYIRNKRKKELKARQAANQIIPFETDR
jgi:D-alanyl-D-alanine carboxypeptidase (penicillin-binding protein 5/6)